MENDAVKDAILYLEKQKAAIEEALLHLTAVPHEAEMPVETEEREASKFSAETRRRMSLAHRHRWDLKRKMAAIKRELGGKRVKIDSLPWKWGKG